MSAIEQLIGTSLVDKNGLKASTSHLIGDAKRVGLYFSAHWCPPCRIFTPKLSTWFSTNAEAQSAKIVFMSLDRNEGAFKEYLHTMSWGLAVPFGEDLIQAAADKFNVEGIPTLIWLDAATGNVITDSGVEQLTAAPTAAWPFSGTGGGGARAAGPGVWKLLQGAKLVDATGKVHDAEDIRGMNSSIGLYFSAHWCPPCRDFTPRLASYYTENGKKSNSGPFEIIFISADRSEREFNEYLGEMPWPAVSFANSRIRDGLSAAYGVSGIPALITFDSSTGEVLSKDARGRVTSDPAGWPWASAGGASAEGGSSGCTVQ